MKKLLMVSLAACALMPALTIAASAGGHYRTGYYYEEPYYVPPLPVGFVFQRHNSRCDYPEGFSAGEFSRNINGIPRGGAELYATGCGAYSPLSP